MWQTISLMISLYILVNVGGWFITCRVFNTEGPGHFSWNWRAILGAAIYFHWHNRTECKHDRMGD